MYIMSQNVLSNHHRSGQTQQQQHTHKLMPSIDTHKAPHNNQNTQKKNTNDSDGRFKPTPDQIRLAQLLHEKDDPEVNSKIKQVLDVIQGTQSDHILLALYDADYDVEKAIDILLDGGRTESISDWTTVRNRKKAASQSEQQQQQVNTPSSDAQPATTIGAIQDHKQKHKQKQRHEKTNNSEKYQHHQDSKESANVNENGNMISTGDTSTMTDENSKFKRNYNNRDNRNQNKDFRMFSNRRRGFKKEGDANRNDKNREDGQNPISETGIGPDVNVGLESSTENVHHQQNAVLDATTQPNNHVHSQNNNYRNNRPNRGTSGNNGHMRRNNSANSANANRNNSQQQQQQQQQQKPRTKPNDNMRNIGTWSNEQIGKNDARKPLSEWSNNEDWENNEEDWDGDLSKTQIYTSTNMQKVKQNDSTDAGEDPKLNSDSSVQRSFDADFPIGHFDAQEATKQIKNAIGLSNVQSVETQQQQQQQKLKTIPSVKPPPPSTKIPKSAVIMPTTSNANSQNVDVQFGVDFGIDQHLLKRDSDNLYTVSAPLAASRKVQQPPQNQINELINDKNILLNKQDTSKSDQNNNKAPNVQSAIKLTQQMDHQLNENKIQKPQPFQAPSSISPVGLMNQQQQHLEQNIDNVLLHTVKQPQQQQQSMIFNTQQQQPQQQQQSQYVIPQKQQQQQQEQQSQKQMISNDYQQNATTMQQHQHAAMRDNMSSINKAMKDVNLNPHQSIINSNIVKQQQQHQQQQNLIQTQTNTNQNGNSNNKPTMPPPPPGVNLMNPNNPFLMSLPLVYYDQNFPYFDNSQLDGNSIMHMYSHQMSQLAPVPTPIPATVTNTNTASNYTTSDTKFNRVDTTLANSQLNSNNAQQQQTYNLIPNFPFILQNYYPNMLIPTPVPNGPQGNSQFQNKPFGFNNTVGYEDAYNTQAQTTKPNELSFTKNLDKQQTNTGYHTPPPPQSSYANPLLNPNLNLNANNLPPQYAYIGSMIGGPGTHTPTQILHTTNNNGNNGVTGNGMQDNKPTLQNTNIKQANKNAFPNTWS